MLLQAASALADTSFIASAAHPPHWRFVRLECGREYVVGDTFSGYSSLARFRLGAVRPRGRAGTAPSPTPGPSASPGAPIPDDPLERILLEGLPKPGDTFTVPVDLCRETYDRAVGAELAYWAEARGSGGLLFSVGPHEPRRAAASTAPSPSPRPYSITGLRPPRASPAPAPSPSPGRAGLAAAWRCDYGGGRETASGRGSLHLSEDGVVTWSSVQTSASGQMWAVACRGRWARLGSRISADWLCSRARGGGSESYDAAVELEVVGEKRLELRGWVCTAAPG